MAGNDRQCGPTESDLENQIFPPIRFQRLIRPNISTYKVSNEALITMNKATVLFLKLLTKCSDNCRRNRRSGRATLIIDDIVAAIRRGGEQLKFLQNCINIIDVDEGETFLEEQQNETINEEHGHEECDIAIVEDFKVDNTIKHKKMSTQVIKKKQATKNLKFADITMFFKRG